jgi:hypothetical protein
MPSAQDSKDRASGNCGGAGGTGRVSNRTLAESACSRFVLGGCAKARGNFSFGGSWGHFQLDALLRACVRPPSAGSSDIRSVTGQTVDASLLSAEPADSRAQA